MSSDYLEQQSREDEYYYDSFRLCTLSLKFGEGIEI